MKTKLTAFLFLCAFLLASCAAPKGGTPTAPSEESSPTAEATATPSVNSEECVACHTDKQRLIDTAAPVVEAEGESKGVG